MGSEVLTLKEILHGVQKAPRVTRQIELESMLSHFRADPIEAAELLPALLGILVEDEEIQHYATWLRKSLERYHRRQHANEIDECAAHHEREARRGD